MGWKSPWKTDHLHVEYFCVFFQPPWRIHGECVWFFFLEKHRTSGANLRNKTVGWITPPENQHGTKKWWFFIGFWISSSRGSFSGSMLVFGGCKGGIKLLPYLGTNLTYPPSKSLALFSWWLSFQLRVAFGGICFLVPIQGKLPWFCIPRDPWVEEFVGSWKNTVFLGKTRCLEFLRFCP